jgi:endonuclease YncB( thermonuclease family)
VAPDELGWVRALGGRARRRELFRIAAREAAQPSRLKIRLSGADLQPRILRDTIAQPSVMAKAVFTLKSGLKVGRTALGAHGDVTGSVRQQTHDGDTVIVDPDGNLGLRFLGIDAPEVSFTLPGSTAFVSIANPRWAEFLDDPFAVQWGPFDPPLDPPLLAFLQPRIGPGAAQNHSELAKAVERELERLIEADIATLVQTPQTFRFFCSFATEVMDAYGRLLCYLNRDQPDADTPEPRPKSYNERLLLTGSVAPYFIWPNLDPYQRAQRLVDAVPPPGGVAPEASTREERQSFDDARQAVRDARANGRGIFDPANPLRLYPFELRLLSRRRPPDRWVIDLSAGDDRLRRPQTYHEIPNAEDRLFVAEEYVPLFQSKGWQTPDRRAERS